MLQVLLAAANNAFVIFLSADIMALVLSIGSLYFEEREREGRKKTFTSNSAWQKNIAKHIYYYAKRVFLPGGSISLPPSHDAAACV